MSQYLKKYVGTYRVMADYDKSTNDFPRDEFGNIDRDFDDLYIKCKNECKIFHYYRDILLAYIPTIGRGNNIIKQIPQEIILEKNQTDSEVTFKFKAINIEIVANVMVASTKGKEISPFSRKNLPKPKYKIPDKDLTLYKDIFKINSSSKNELMQFLLTKNKEFDNVLSKTKLKGKDVRTLKKQSCLKAKEFYHSIGAWEDYIKFLQQK